MTVDTLGRFPPDEIAIKIALTLAVGMLVGFEREPASKDVGIRTFGLTALIGTLSILISPAYVPIAMAGVIVLVGLGHTFTPVAAAILMTLLLAWKVELQRGEQPSARADLQQPAPCGCC